MSDRSLFPANLIVGAGIMATQEGLTMRGVGCFAQMPDPTVLGRIDMRRVELKRGEKVWFSIPARLQGQPVRIIGAATHAIDAGKRNGFFGVCVVTPQPALTESGFYAVLVAVEALFDDAANSVLDRETRVLNPSGMESALAHVAHIDPRPSPECDRSDYAVVTIPPDWSRYIGLDSLMLLVGKRDRQRDQTGYVLAPRDGTPTIPAQALAQHVQLLFGKEEPWEDRYHEANAQLAEAAQEIQKLTKERNAATEERNYYQNDARAHRETAEVRLRELNEARQEAQRLRQGGAVTQYAPRPGVGSTGRPRPQPHRDYYDDGYDDERRTKGKLNNYSLLALGLGVFAIIIAGYFGTTSVLNAFNKPEENPAAQVAAPPLKAAENEADDGSAAGISAAYTGAASQQPDVSVQDGASVCATSKSPGVMLAALTERCGVTGGTQCGAQMQKAYGEFATELKNCGNIPAFKTCFDKPWVKSLDKKVQNFDGIDPVSVGTLVQCLHVPDGGNVDFSAIPDEPVKKNEPPLRLVNNSVKPSANANAPKAKANGNAGKTTNSSVGTSASSSVGKAATVGESSNLGAGKLTQTFQDRVTQDAVVTPGSKPETMPEPAQPTAAPPKESPAPKESSPAPTATIAPDSERTDAGGNLPPYASLPTCKVWAVEKGGIFRGARAKGEWFCKTKK